MSAVAVVTPTEAHNLTEQCDWFSEDNQTEPRVTERLDAAGCLFAFILPCGQAVPALIWFFVLLTLFSFLVNGLTLFGLCRSEELSWEPRVTLFKNLILSDLMKTVTLAPPLIHSLVHCRTMVFSVWCHIQYFVGTISIFSSLVTNTCMALERYLFVCHAIHYSVILTPLRLRLVLCFIWIYSVFISTMNTALLHTGGEQENEQVTRGLLCEPGVMEQHMGFPRAAAVFRKTVGFCTRLLCLLVYAFSYHKMYQVARNAMIPFNACKTVLFYCGMLLLQLLPVLLNVMSDALYEVDGTLSTVSSQHQGVPRAKPAPSATAAALHMSLLAVLLVPPCINPLVFGLGNEDTREALTSLCRWLVDRGGAVVRRAQEIRAGNVSRNEVQAV